MLAAEQCRICLLEFADLVARPRVDLAGSQHRDDVLDLLLVVLGPAVGQLFDFFVVCRMFMVDS